jgi:hypothetical protein
MAPARRIVYAGAYATSAVGIAMAAAAALERGTTTTDRALIITVAVTITLAAHLLPAISRRRAAWALWAICVVLTVYGHGVFFSAAAARAGATRAEAVQEDTHTHALREQLATAQARPASVVATALAQAQSQQTTAELALARCERATPGRCMAPKAARQLAQQRITALTTEQAESARAASLQAELTHAAATLDTRRSAATADPIAAQLAALVGIKSDHISTLVSILSAVVIELLAAMLWAEALTTPAQPDQNITPKEGARNHAHPHSVAVPGTATLHRVTTPCASTVKPPRHRLQKLHAALINWLAPILARAHRSSA